MVYSVVLITAIQQNDSVIHIFGASLIAQLVKICLQYRRPQFDSWVRKMHWRRDRLPTLIFLGFPCVSAIKNPPTMWETWVQSLGLEDPLQKGMATHSSILAWRIPGTVESDTTE